MTDQQPTERTPDRVFFDVRWTPPGAYRAALGLASLAHDAQTLARERNEATHLYEDLARALGVPEYAPNEVPLGHTAKSARHAAMFDRIKALVERESAFASATEFAVVRWYAEVKAALGVPVLHTPATHDKTMERVRALVERERDEHVAHTSIATAAALDAYDRTPGTQLHRMAVAIKAAEAARVAYGA